jgi:hypothetical protein
VNTTMRFADTPLSRLPLLAPEFTGIKLKRVLQDGWNPFLLVGKVWEYDRVRPLLSGRSERLRALERLTGHRIGA